MFPLARLPQLLPDIAGGMRERDDHTSCVQVFHRLDNANGSGVWTNKIMVVDGQSGGDASASAGLSLG